MSEHPLYQAIHQQLGSLLPSEVSETTRRSLVLLVLGMLEGKSARPARIAQALSALGVSHAQVESLERRVRRIQNDTHLTAALCFHPFAHHHLLLGKPRQLVLILDPTTQDERVVLLTVAVRYRGRALPLAWLVWEANQPLTGAGFWERVASLLALVAPLLPPALPVIWLADRAFGTPAFTDLLQPYGWHYVVRVQGQTRYRDARGRVRPLADLVVRAGQRRKGRGQVFKKQGWRSASVVVVWGHPHTSPLCLVTDLSPDWSWHCSTAVVITLKPCCGTTNPVAGSGSRGRCATWSTCNACWWGWRYPPGSQ